MSPLKTDLKIFHHRRYLHKRAVFQTLPSICRYRHRPYPPHWALSWTGSIQAVRQCRSSTGRACIPRTQDRTHARHSPAHAWLFAQWDCPAHLQRSCGRRYHTCSKARRWSFRGADRISRTCRPIPLRLWDPAVRVYRCLWTYRPSCQPFPRWHPQ